MCARGDRAWRFHSRLSIIAHRIHYHLSALHTSGFPIQRSRQNSNFQDTSGLGYSPDWILSESGSGVQTNKPKDTVDTS